MKIESERLAGLSVEQRERLTEALTALGNQMIDDCQTGLSKVYSITTLDGKCACVLGCTLNEPNSQSLPLTEWSQDYVDMLERLSPDGG